MKILDLEGHYIVCGFGRMGKGIIEGLRQQSKPFVIVDNNPANTDYFENENFLYVIGDATAEETLKEAGIENAKVLLALLPSDADNLYLSIAAKELKPKIFLIARAIFDIAEKRLKKSGTDLVISPYKVASVHALNAANTLNPGMNLELGQSSYGVPVCLREVIVKKTSKLVSQSIANSGLKPDYSTLIVGIKKESGDVQINPDPDIIIQSGDILVLTGEDDNLDRVQAICN